jgi:hypothetical protein
MNVTTGGVQCVSTGGGVTGSGTANRVALWSSGSTLTDSNIVQNNSRVGINTTAPNSTLHVVGDANITGVLYASNISSNSPLNIMTAGTTRLFINDTTGYIGVGTRTPSASLDVNGTIQSNGDIVQRFQYVNMSNSTLQTVSTTALTLVQTFNFNYNSNRTLVSLEYGATVSGGYEPYFSCPNGGRGELQLRAVDFNGHEKVIYTTAINNTNEQLKRISLVDSKVLDHAFKFRNNITVRVYVSGTQGSYFDGENYVCGGGAGANIRNQTFSVNYIPETEFIKFVSVSNTTSINLEATLSLIASFTVPLSGFRSVQRLTYSANLSSIGNGDQCAGRVEVRGVSSITGEETTLAIFRESAGYAQFTSLQPSFNAAIFGNSNNITIRVYGIQSTGTYGYHYDPIGESYYWGCDGLTSGVVSQQSLNIAYSTVPGVSMQFLLSLNQVIDLVHGDVSKQFVGINTTTPLQTLHVMGSIASNHSAYFATTGGSVGINTTTPLQTLHVMGSIASNRSAYFATSGGSVGIGTVAPAYTLDVTGTLRTTGAKTGFLSDIAEVVEENLTRGDVVAVSFEDTVAIMKGGNIPIFKVRKSRGSTDADVIGVVFEKLLFDDNYAASEGTTIRTGDRVQVATHNAITFLKASAENGPIIPGDYLMPARTAGYAMKADATANIVLGRSLGTLSSGTGTLNAFISIAPTVGVSNLNAERLESAPSIPQNIQALGITKPVESERARREAIAEGTLEERTSRENRVGDDAIIRLGEESRDVVVTIG